MLHVTVCKETDLLVKPAVILSLAMLHCFTFYKLVTAMR